MFGAAGDGMGDDGPALNAMFGAAAAEDGPVRIDLGGTWHTGETVVMRSPAQSTILAGSFVALPGTQLEPIVAVDLGSVTEVRGIMRVRGANKASRIANRQGIDAVQLWNSARCVFTGWDVADVQRWGIRNIGGGTHNHIKAALGHVRAFRCGSPGGTGSAAHTKRQGVLTGITREGKAGSVHQRAWLAFQGALPEVRPDDILLIAGRHCFVKAVHADGLEVYPWPEAEGDIEPTVIDAIVGGGIELMGGNTAQLTIASLAANYVGHGLWVRSLYGCIASGIMAEVAGVGLTVGGPHATTYGASVQGLHPEIVGVHVLQGGLGRSVARCTLISPAVEVDIARVVPTIGGGRQNLGYPVTLHQYPQPGEQLETLAELDSDGDGVPDKPGSLWARTLALFGWPS